VVLEKKKRTKSLESQICIIKKNIERKPIFTGGNKSQQANHRYRVSDRQKKKDENQQGK